MNWLLNINMETLTLEELLEAKQVLDFQIGQIIKTGGGNLQIKYGGAWLARSRKVLIF